MSDISIYERLKAQADNTEKFDQMVVFFRNADNQQELDQVMTLFLFDMTYSRADILRAEKCVRLEKRWP